MSAVAQGGSKAWEEVLREGLWEAKETAVLVLDVRLQPLHRSVAVLMLSRSKPVGYLAKTMSTRQH